MIVLLICNYLFYFNLLFFLKKTMRYNNFFPVVFVYFSLMFIIFSIKLHFLNSEIAKIFIKENTEKCNENLLFLFFFFQYSFNFFFINRNIKKFFLAQLEKTSMGIFMYNIFKDFSIDDSNFYLQLNVIFNTSKLKVN